MKKFLVEFSAALIAWLIVLVATFGFAPYHWFWPMFGTALTAAIIYISYRFSRLWNRRCIRCGSLNIACEKRMRRPDGIPPIGRKLECEVLIICHNPSCPLFMRERGKNYIKVFTGFELWWRRFVLGEKLP
mgnify:CR=1 FL=1